MNTRLLFCFLLSAFCFPVCGGTFHVQWLFRDASSNVLSVKQVFIQPIAAYGVDASTVIISGDRLTKTSDASGSLIISNLFSGRSYKVELVGPYLRTIFTNTFSTNVVNGSLVNGADPEYLSAPIRDTGVVAYSQAAADARFHQVAGDTSTNAIFRGTIKIPAGATVGYVFTVTNSDGSGAWQAATSAGSTSNFLAGQNTIWATVGGSNQVSITGTLTNNTTGSAASATIASSVTNFISPIHLLTSQPRSGAKSTGNFSSTVVTNSNYLLISQPGTTGVVRRLDFMLDVGADGFANTNLTKINLMIFSDSNLVVNAPAADIFGVRYYAPSNGWRVIKDTTWISSTASDSIVPNTYFTWYYYASLYFPMPFTNGMYAKLTNTSGAAWPNGYIAAQHIDASPLPAEFSRYRLTTFTTNMPISGSTSQFVFSVTGKGQLLAVSMALSNSYGDAIVGFEDSSGFAYVADEVVMKPSGVDDYFGASWGGAQGVFTGHRHGQTSWEYNSTTNSWKENYVHFKDNPLTWTNSLRFYLDSGPIDQGVFTFWMLREL